MAKLEAGDGECLKEQMLPQLQQKERRKQRQTKSPFFLECCSIKEKTMCLNIKEEDRKGDKKDRKSDRQL